MASRVDNALVDKGLAPTRSRARDMVARGHVSVDGTRVTKPGRLISEDAALVVDDPAASYVSRAALKLVAGLDAGGIDVTDLAALDLGASTGGFTQLLLERGARHVTAVDVGHGQFHGSLRDDPRVTLHENLNARDVVEAHLPQPPDIIVSDMSFVSLTKAAGPALALAAPRAWAVLLVKPQFELEPAQIGKGGLVRDMKAVSTMLAARQDWLDAQPGWRAVDCLPSPIAGGDGNREHLLIGRRDG